MSKPTDAELIKLGRLALAVVRAHRKLRSIDGTGLLFVTAKTKRDEAVARLEIATDKLLAREKGK